MKSHLQLRQLAVFTFLLLQFSYFSSNAQTHIPRHESITGNSGGFYEYLPKNYHAESDRYPLIIFLHGSGELGNGNGNELPRVLANGTPRTIRDGNFPASFNVNGETFKFIVISPQFINWPSTGDVQAVIDYAVRNYRVNTSRIYLTGVSMGGGAVWDYAGASSDNARRLAAIVPVCGASGAEDNRVSVITRQSLPVWATHNQGDDVVPVSNTINYIDKILSLSRQLNLNTLVNGNPIVKKTIFQVVSHDAWTTSYSLDFKENNKNIYEWMLQFTQGSVPSAAAAAIQNQSPSANAGSDQTITLPNNSVTLSGSGNDPDGGISGYSWSKVSGPSQHSINNGSISNPTINNLTEGTYTFRLTVTDNSGATAYDDINITVNSAPSVAAPVSGNTVTIPGTIQTENYNSMYGVINQPTTDDGGGQNVGWITGGDWMNYRVNVTQSGNYTVNFRIATTYDAQQLELKTADGTVLTTVTIPQTGGYQNWRTIGSTVYLNAGVQTLTIAARQTGSWNINWVDFVAVTSASVSGYSPVPGKIEAENYNSMYGVITEPTRDANGGQDVGWIEQNDWIDYNINVASTGTYNVNFRVASPFAGQQLQVRSSNGAVLTTANVPQTGDFQIWRTVTSSLYLNAGSQTVRVYSTSPGWWNLNYVEFSSASAPAAIAGLRSIPGKIEAENYSTMFGVIDEPTTDDGGGSDVGWIEHWDWLNYNVNVTASGNYTANFRVATPFANQQLEVRTASGEVLARLNLPQTGGFQIWKTVSIPLHLFAGNQTISLVSMQNGWWNINWMDFELGGVDTYSSNAPVTGSLSGALPAAETLTINKQVFSIYPNPVEKTFTMQLKNNFTGTMNVQVINLAGILVKQYKLSKGTTVSQVNLSVGDLPTGTYYLKVQIGNWTETKKMIKR